MWVLSAGGVAGKLAASEEEMEMQNLRMDGQSRQCQESSDRVTSFAS
jgi:hypothetical protein